LHSQFRDDKEEKVTEVKPTIKSFHPMINPIIMAPQKIQNGVKLPPERGDQMLYAEQRYKLISGVNFLPFDAKPKMEISEEFESRQTSNYPHDEYEKKLLSGDEKSKNSQIDFKEKPSEPQLERIKSDPGKFRTTKSMIAREVFKSNSRSHSEEDSQVSEYHIMANKFGKMNPQDANDDDKTDFGENKRIKGGIDIEDGYYKANIHSCQIEDLGNSLFELIHTSVFKYFKKLKLTKSLYGNLVKVSL
jgi:hypothetical protein